MAEQGLSQHLTQRQEQIMAPQQLQSLEVLLTPLLELQDKLNHELERNPIIEQDWPESEPLPAAGADDADDHAGADGAETKADFTHDNLPLRSAIPTGEIDNGSDDSLDHEINELFDLNSDWQDYKNDYTGYENPPDEQEKRDFMFNSIIEQPSIQEQLLEQLRLTDVVPAVNAAAEQLIGSIDETGYLRIAPDELVGGNCTRQQAQQALDLVQSFDPPGIGARTLQECLLLQMARKNDKDKKLITLIKSHLDDIGKNHLPQVAKAMKISLEELHLLINKLKDLTPHPATAIAPGNPVFVVPEVFVEPDGEEFKITVNNEYLPRLRISSTYQRMLQDPNTNSEAKEYIRNKILNGKMLIRSLEQRQSTIHRIAQVIVDSQYSFLKYGIEHLHPLTMQQVADKLGLHETTISRAIANKYMQTPNGMFEFKFFFSCGYRALDGEELSSKSIQEKINDLITREDPDKPLSDSKLSALLKKNGLTVARRTVAKYRENLGIPPSHLRKEHL
jgi:RNA polymerase sigma-54 factor